MTKLTLGVLGSGKGSNYKAIQQAIDANRLNAEVRVVISDVESAGILKFARECGTRAEFVAPGKFKTKLEPEAEQHVVGILQNERVDLVVLAGFMRMVKEPLLHAFPHRIINIHPSLLPKFRGLEAWRQALEAGEKITGCTVHWVEEGMDTGDVIAQREVPVRTDDTAESLHARIQVAEHEVFPEAIAKIAAEILR